MKQVIGKRAVAIAAAMALTVSISPVHADTQTNTQAEIKQENQMQDYKKPVIGKVNISNGAYFELHNVQELEQTTDKIVSFTVRFNNQANKNTLDFMDYWVRLKTKSGNSFTVTLISDSKDKDTIPAGSYQDYQFYAKVSKSTALSDLQFQFIQWDFSQSSFERALGTVSMTQQYKASVPENRSYAVISDNLNFATHIERTLVGKNDKNYLPSITFVMQNKGNQALKGLNLQFHIRTANGLFYPLKSSISDTTEFNPLEEKKLLLTGTIPVGAGEEGWDLVLTQAVTKDSGTVQVPLASYDLPASQGTEVSIGAEQSFSTEDGTYNAQLTSITRVPWEDEDILISDVVLKNTGTTSLPIPPIQGRYKLDEAVTMNAELIQFDNVLAIAPGKEITVQFLSKIPYTYEFQKIELFIDEKVDENTTASELVRFQHSSELNELPTVKLKNAYTVKSIGKQAELIAKKVDTYTSGSTKLVSAVVDATNLEKRYTQTGNFVAQFRTLDGAVYPATVVKPAKDIAPKGKAMLSFQTNVPAGVNTDQLQLLLGEAVQTTSGSSSTQNGTDGNTTTTAYVNAAVFELPKELAEPKADFKELDIYPYTLSLSKIGTQIDFDSNQLKIEFNYLLERDALVEADLKDRRVIVELEDRKTGYKVSHELKLEDSSTTEGPLTEDTLEIGEHKIELRSSEGDLRYELGDLINYKLNVYEQVKTGYKKLIATKELRWFVYNE